MTNRAGAIPHALRNKWWNLLSKAPCPGLLVTLRRALQALWKGEGGLEDMSASPLVATPLAERSGEPRSSVAGAQYLDAMDGNFWQHIKDWFASDHPEQPLLIVGSAGAAWGKFFEQLQETCGCRPEDVVRVGGEEKSIKVKEVRAALGLIQRTSFAGRRLVIIPAAERLRHEAANTLLKELEEPSRTNRFVLTTAYRGRLLPTIVSRCRVMRLPAELKQAAASVDDESDPRAILQQIAAPGRKQPLTDEELEQISRHLEQLLRQGETGADVRRALLRLRDYYKIRAHQGNEKLASDVLLATVSQIKNT